ncbi:hypothetical protein HMN09_00046300 [Mycena chlorophos]|uniref:Peptidase S9 prolyl oligopeptidase catalytic domain-containing protein n=1 Tax=Mycena chlorophos TaxID=658473 RepID=A0A8H6TVU6_MYCCL|nr:hypothetical protein HMN09_00046300 [Mycena chlorophos]
MRATLFLACLCSRVSAMSPQTILALGNSWKLDLSRSWDVLGPFPIHAREQHFLSPSFPINISEPLDLKKTYPSAYADNGTVGWSKTEATAEGDLQVSFPDVRWSALRATEGWSALQHHAVAHTTITVFPPTGSTDESPPRLLVQLIQGAYIAILDLELSTSPQWHAGNIYDMERTLPRAIELPTAPSTTSPTTYHVFLCADYEIRLFGDPQSGLPVQQIKLTVDIESIVSGVLLEPTQNVACDFLDGRPFGDALGIGLRSLGGWWTVSTAKAENLALELVRPILIAPSQTRIVPLRILEGQYTGSAVEIVLNLSSRDGQKAEVTTSLPINQLPAEAAIISASYFAAGVPTNFVAVSPIHDNDGPPILALHGAGVDIISNSFWPEALPRQQTRWIVVPTGRTPWGLDWHGPSAKEAWSSVDALVSILRARQPSIHLEEQTPVLLIGHSNGGQGAWYLASRFPDRVLGVLPAAAYIKSQAYVALSMSRSAHFIDPAVRAILETSLTPDDDDLFLSNLVDTPLLAIHGGADENVPVWHSREAVGVLKAWNNEANATFREPPGKGHWYPGILDNDATQSFVDQVFASEPRPRSNTFTLTVAIPSESGSLHGFKIERLRTPGRLARLTVLVQDEDVFKISTTNVQRFSMQASARSLVIDGQIIDVDLGLHGPIFFERQARKSSWKLADDLRAAVAQPSGRIQSFLSSPAPFRILVLDSANSQHLLLALRIAHDLHAYHRLDSEIVLLEEHPHNAPEGNVLVIGDTSSPALGELLKNSPTPFRVTTQQQRWHIEIQDSVLDAAGLGILFLHPHPRNSIGQMLFLLGTDGPGLERAARLFPIRTGVTVPDWIITSSRADEMGAGGIIGAGVYGNNWTFNDVMSWLY